MQIRVTFAALFMASTAVTASGAACISNDECQTESCSHEKCAAIDDVSTLVCGH